MTACAPEDGRGHVHRALAIAEAVHPLGGRPQLELLRGRLGAVEAARAAGIGMPVAAASEAGSADVTVLDVPDVEREIGVLDPRRLVVIDDRNALVSPAAVVIQPSQLAWSGSARVDRVLAGYRYAPVGSAYRRLRARREVDGPRPARASGPLRLFVSFGGSDPAHVTERMVAAVAGGHSWQVDVVVGPGSAVPAGGWGVTVVRDPADLPERMAAADLALIGAGTMKFEAACIGLPSVLLAVADDQLAVGPAFAATGAAVFLGDGRRMATAVVRTALEELAVDPKRRAAMARAAWAAIDGNGATRVAEAAMNLAQERP